MTEAEPVGECIHELVAAQAARTPAAVAVVCAGESLTYAALEARATALAHVLRAQGVGPEVRVGVLMERSAALVVTLLGVLKAGGAYVPLDPEYPAERLRYMVADSGATVLVTTATARTVVSPIPGDITELVVPAVLQAPSVEVGATRRSANCGARPGGLAYIFYTSGSTGVPKGVALTHGNGVTFLAWAGAAFSAEERAVVMAPTSVGFDLSIFEIFMPLSTGGTVLMVADALAIASWSAPPGGFLPSLLNTVPSAAAALVRGDTLPPSVRTINLAGEPLRADLAAALYAKGVERVYNLYGPTEATTYATWGLAGRGDRQGVVPIGRPITRTQVYVLDGRGAPVPIGVPGELYIGGAQVARGYWRRPGLTAERFVPDPFGPTAGRRLYRTGDRVRWRADGTLEFLGRLDHQVKLRGFRIELGEIEAVLRAQAGVRDAVALVREDTPGDQRLVAYVVPEPPGAPTPADLPAALRGQLTTRLPRFMVPSTCIVLDALPLTPNGKVDRAALPAPASERAAAGAYMAPRTELERTVAAIWTEVLGVEQIGVHDNFFELGGDSIVALRIVARAARAGLDVKPAQLLRAPTIAQLVSYAIAAANGPTMPALSPNQQWFLEERADLRTSQSECQSMILELERTTDLNRLEHALRHVYARHPALHARFAKSDGHWRLIDATRKPDDEIIIERLSLRVGVDQAQEIENAASALGSSWNLERGPLLRVALAYCGASRPLCLLCVMHQLTADDASWGILIGEWARAYQQLTAGEPIALPAVVPLSRLLAQAVYASNTKSQTNRGFSMQMRECLPTSIPVDVDSGQNTHASADSLHVVLSQRYGHALVRDTPKAYRMHVEEILLTAVARALGEWTGSSTVRIDIEASQRGAWPGGLDLSHTVGWLAPRLSLLLDSKPDADAADALCGTKETYREVLRRGAAYGRIRMHESTPGDPPMPPHAAPADLWFTCLGSSVVSLAATPFVSVAPCSWLDTKQHVPVKVEGLRSHLVEVVARITGHGVDFLWTYSRAIHRPQTIQRVANRCRDILISLIDHCAMPGAGTYTPSDFPGLASLDRQELTAILSKLPFD